MLQYQRIFSKKIYFNTETFQYKAIIIFSECAAELTKPWPYRHHVVCCCLPPLLQSAAWRTWDTQKLQSKRNGLQPQLHPTFSWKKDTDSLSVNDETRDISHSCDTGAANVLAAKRSNKMFVQLLTAFERVFCRAVTAIYWTNCTYLDTLWSCVHCIESRVYLKKLSSWLIL